MRDPGFPRGGGANPGGRQHTILPKFSKKCMKLKELGPLGVGGGLQKDPPLEVILIMNNTVILRQTAAQNGNRFQMTAEILLRNHLGNFVSVILSLHSVCLSEPVLRAQIKSRTCLSVLFASHNL